MEHGGQDYSFDIFVNGKEAEVAEGDFGIGSGVRDDDSDIGVMKEGFEETVERGTHI